MFFLLKQSNIVLKIDTIYKNKSISNLNFYLMLNFLPKIHKPFEVMNLADN